MKKSPFRNFIVGYFKRIGDCFSTGLATQMAHFWQNILQAQQISSLNTSWIKVFVDLEVKEQL